MSSTTSYTIPPPHTPWVGQDGRPTQLAYRYFLGRLGSGAQVPGAINNNVWTGTNTFTSTVNFTGSVEVGGTVITFPSGGGIAGLTANNTFSGTNNFTSTFEIGGVAQTFPASGKLVGVTDTQTITNKTLTSLGNTIGGAQLVGTNTNDNANAGNVGEYISATLTSGAAVTITSGSPRNITSISLTAGDWDVSGNVVFVPAGTTVPTAYIAWIGSVSASLPTLPNNGAITQMTATFGTGATAVIQAGRERVSVNATTTIYLEAQASFTVSTMTGYGFIGARRRR